MMRTTFRIRQPYADLFQKCADEHVCRSPARPERFIRKMQTHNGIARRSFHLIDEGELEPGNPVIVALGDSVTAGRFESLMTPALDAAITEHNLRLQTEAELDDSYRKTFEDRVLPYIEVFDARESYVEKFREKLIDKYEKTSVSVINSGIAGDTLPSMAARAERDVIRYDPDLILFNGSLNWDETYGDAEDFRRILRALIRRFKEETNADIILLTPNGDVAGSIFNVPEDEWIQPTTWRRVEVIRSLAEEEQVCLADVRAVWDEAKRVGCPWEELLSNHMNHPSVEGHEVYAKVLMKLFD